MSRETNQAEQIGIEAGSGYNVKRKDCYDKLSAIAPIINGVAVASAVGFATVYYNVRQSERQIELQKSQAEKQIELQKIDVTSKFLPFLQTGDKSMKQIALAAISEIGQPVLAAKLAPLVGDASIELLTSLKQNPDPEVQAAAVKSQNEIDQNRKNLQQQLKTLGFYSGPLDGTDSVAFRKSVQEFQKAHKLMPDGFAGPLTISWIQRCYENSDSCKV